MNGSNVQFININTYKSIFHIFGYQLICIHKSTTYQIKIRATNYKNLLSQTVLNISHNISFDEFESVNKEGQAW